VADGVSGFLVDPLEPREIAAALRTLLSDRALTRKLGEQARERVVRDFAWTGMAHRVQDILRSSRTVSRRVDVK
jgi:phosphatidylinositol alpha-1,6-mannosyltransferase